jgi:hypothetical protein
MGPDAGRPAFIKASYNSPPPDCPMNGCPQFPAPAAPACAGAAPINLVYPNDGVFVPPNMNVISVQWTPFGAYKEFEVAFTNKATDMRIVTTCAAQTMDTGQPSQASGGCELVLTQQMWQTVADQNRGADAVTISVRGTTDGTCATKSANSVQLTFAEEDLLGAIYYWKSLVSAGGTGGEIWVKSFGDAVPETDITTPLGLGTCNGCHALSRDGLRMVINSDDADSDDEYSDVMASLIDMNTRMIILPPPGLGARRGNNRGAMLPSFATFYPDHTLFVMSNGLGLQNPPTNVMNLFDGNTDALLATLMNVGALTQLPTMPDWSPDGKNVVFVLPQKTAAWTGKQGGNLGRNDDDHIFGGSLYTMPYTGNRMFGPPSAKPLLMSAGENNYYPAYSPDGELVVFDRVALDKSVPTIDGCVTTPNALCPNDSFSNPNARVTLMKNMPGAAPIDLENANGSPASAPKAFSNSWPKWSPFLQSYKGNKMLWVAFSSTRDYGLRVRNNQTGMYQCYPPDSLQLPAGDHGTSFAPSCKQPQLWMAAINVSIVAALDAVGGNAPLVAAMDPSKPAFWLPFQDIMTHNHTPQWTQRIAGAPPGMCMNSGANCMKGGVCCPPLICTGNGTCQPIAQ